MDPVSADEERVRQHRDGFMDTDQIVAAILAAAQTAADGHNRADSYITNYRIMLGKLREAEPDQDGKLDLASGERGPE